MSKAIIEFSLIKTGDKEFTVDPNSFGMNGGMGFNYIEEFLFSETEWQEEVWGNEFNEKVDENCREVIMEIWLDSDDYRSWIDYKVLKELPNESKPELSGKAGEKEIIFKAIPTAERQPKDFASIHFVLLDGRLPMMAQYNPQGWCHLSGIPATKPPQVIGGKGVSHWLELTEKYSSPKPLELPSDDTIENKAFMEAEQRYNDKDNIHLYRNGYEQGQKDLRDQIKKQL